MDQPEERQHFLGSQAHSMLEKMYDTFLKYLQLSAVRPYIQGTTFEESADTSDVLNWIYEGEDEEQYDKCKQFIDALKAAFHAGSENVLQGQTHGKVVNHYTQLLIATLEGDLMRTFSKENVSDIAESLTKQGLITQGHSVEIKRNLERQSPEEVCIDMFSMVKRGKVDWPFMFLEAAVAVQPQVQSEVQGGNSVAEVSSGTFGLSDLPANFSDHPRSIQDRDEIRYGYRNKARVTEEERENMQQLISLGAISENQLTIDSDVSETSMNNFNIKSGFSDGEEDKSESEETEKGAKKKLKLREYQKELAETALTGRNTIICAPTGSGKTRVSTYIILHHLQAQEPEGKRRKVAFLARTVPLVLQQHKSLQEFLPQYTIGQVTGEDEQRKSVHFLLPRLNVVVMTPRILENHINHDVLKMEDFSLIVFDECHHTREDEPYNTLMFKYLQTKMKNSSVKLPQIVGLTASIGIGNAVREDDAVENILKICGNLDCNNISMVHRNKDELRQTVPVPEEEILDLRERGYDESVKAIETVMKALETEMECCANDLKDDAMQKLMKQIRRSPKKSQQYNQLVVKLKALARSFPILDRDRETNMSVRSLIILADYLKEYNFALDAYDLVELNDVMAYLEKSFEKYKDNERRSRGETRYFKCFQDLQEDLRKSPVVKNSNLKILAITLREHLIEKGKRTRGIVFVRTRALCYALVTWLKRCTDQELRNLNGQMFTGTGASAHQLGMTQADQEAVIQEFRNGDTRLLVATTVAEEGLDVPDCNLVVKYNHVGNEVTTVQTRGRSRMAGGTSVLLAMGKVRDREIANLGKTKLMEAALEQIRQMDHELIQQKNIEHQKQRMIDTEKNELLKQQAKRQVSDVKFTMVCALCRKVTIESTDIRTIENVHRVVVNSSIWENVKVLPYDESRRVDNVRMLGSVRCLGQPEDGKYCFNNFGSMIFYNNTPFVVLGIKNFVFETQQGAETLNFKQWKLAPFKIDELEIPDIRRFLNLPEAGGESGDGDSSGFQSAEQSQKEDIPKEMRMVGEDEKEENTQGKTFESLDGETCVKQIYFDVQAQQQQQQLFVDSGRFSEKAVQSHEITVPKEIANANNQQDYNFSTASSEAENSGAHGHSQQQIVIIDGAQALESQGISTYNSSVGYHNTDVLRQSLQERTLARAEKFRIDKVLNQEERLNFDSVQRSMERIPFQENQFPSNVGQFHRNQMQDEQRQVSDNVSMQSSLQLLISSSTHPSSEHDRSVRHEELDMRAIQAEPFPEGHHAQALHMQHSLQLNPPLQRPVQGEAPHHLNAPPNQQAGIRNQPRVQENGGHSYQQNPGNRESVRIDPPRAEENGGHNHQQNLANQDSVASSASQGSSIFNVL